MVSSALEIGRESLTEEKVIMSVDHHFVSKLAEMKKWVRRSRVAVEGGHHKFSLNPKHGDFL